VETPPVTETTEAAPTASAQSAQTAVAEESKTVEPVPPLDVAAFHEAVLKDVGPSYTEVNPCTIFYEARDKGLVTGVEHISQAIDYWNYLVGLSEEAFSSIWGYSLEDAIQHTRETGCPTCTTCSGGTDIDSKARHAGMAYYAVLLDVRHTLKKRDDLYQLAHSGIDWKAKLAPQHQTLYYLGELAEEIMGTSK
jgi:hypothetical protein